MRLAVFLLSSCVLFGQATGKPGVTDPIKDPQQIPGNAHPGPIPRATPLPAAGKSAEPKADQTRSRTSDKKAKKQPKQEKEKVSPPTQ
jgi:hypothetical protein